MTRYIQMNEEEFISKLLQGEREFSYIQLPRFADLSCREGYPEMNKSLKSVPKNPLILRYASLEGLKALEIMLANANLYRACLRNAELPGANLTGVKGIKTDFSNADLSFADFSAANLMLASFARSFLKKTNLSYVRNLERALYLEHAIFDQTIVTRDEKRIINTAQGRICQLRIQS